MAQIGYADFIRVFNVNELSNWVPGLEVRMDGIWVVPAGNGNNLFPEERACLAEHPENDLSKPALPLPCDQHQLEKFLSWLGMPLEVFIGDKWCPGQDVVKEFGLQDFQLFDLLKEGVRARTITGLEVVNENRLERRGKDSFENLEKSEFLKEGAAESGIVMKGSGLVGTRPRKRSVNEIRKDAEIAFEKQPKDVLVIPNGCEAISYSLSYDDNLKRMAAILRAVGFLYKRVDVIRYMWAHNIMPSKSSGPLAQQEQSEQATDITKLIEKQPRTDILSSSTNSGKKEDEAALTVEDYVQKRRTNGIDVDVIANELFDKNGPFKLTNLECAHALNLKGDDQYVEVMTLKQRGARAVRRGKQKILQQTKTTS